MIVNNCRKNADWSMLLQFLSGEASFVFENGDMTGYDLLSNEDIVALCSLIGRGSQYPKAKFQGKVLAFFESEWNRITEDAKQVIFDTVTFRFPSISAKFSLFIIAELLGRFFADQKALQSLTASSKSRNNVTRTFSVVGLAKLARYTSDPQIRQYAMELISHLTSDPSPNVSEEAHGVLPALGRLSPI